MNNEEHKANVVFLLDLVDHDLAEVLQRIDGLKSLNCPFAARESANLAIEAKVLKRLRSKLASKV